MKLAAPAIAAVPSPPGTAGQAQALLEKGEVLAISTRNDQVTLLGQDGLSLSGEDTGGSARGLKEKARELLLPRDYPESVSKDYLASRKWNVVRRLAGSVVSYVGTASALEAVGVGAGPLTVGLAWMLRDSVDGIGRFAGSMHAKHADADPKGMLFKGEVINNVGYLAESTLALVPGGFLAIAPGAQIVKALGASYKSAAEGPIETHQAIAHNLAEVRAKNSNQDLVVDAIGGGLAFGLEKLGRSLIGPAAAPVLSASAAAVRIWATHNYVQCLDLDPVSEQDVLEDLSSWLGEKPSKENGMKKFQELELGAPVEGLVKDVERFTELTGLYRGQNYLLDLQDGKTRVVFREQAEGQDYLKATVQAGLLQRLRHGGEYQRRAASEGTEKADRWAVETSFRAIPDDVEGLVGNPPAENLRFDVAKPRAQWKDGADSGLFALTCEEFKQLL